MKPKSLSASAIQVANLCLARYKAENIIYGRAPGNQYAMLGSAVHGALELYVKACYLDKTEQPGVKLLLEFFELSYVQVFGTTETSGDDWNDGIEMLKAWHKRTDFNEFKIISCEVKESFGLKTSAGVIPFNYILDRHDELPNGDIRAVDYKTNRWGYSPADLKQLPQARCYALALNIKYPQAERIWVEFDMLRHDGPVGVSFTPEENRGTYKWLRDEAERIIATPIDNPPETLNTQCLFCVRKTNCNAFKKHVAAGGVMSYDSPTEAIQRRADLEYSKKMILKAIEELDGFILGASKETDVFEWENDSMEMEVGVTRSTRTVDPDRAALVLGDEVMSQYGGRKLTIKAVDTLLKSDEIDDQQKRDLRSLIYSSPGRPTVKVKPKDKFEEDF